MITRSQAFTKKNPCPICGGYDQMARGSSIRCYGFISEDGEWAYCTREEKSVGITINLKTNAFPHKMYGSCQCGVQHNPVRTDRGTGGSYTGQLVDFSRYQSTSNKQGDFPGRSSVVPTGKHGATNSLRTEAVSSSGSGVNERQLPAYKTGSEDRNQLLDDSWVTANYDYYSEDGSVLLFRVVRYTLPEGGKTFRQWRPGKGGNNWIRNLHGVATVPYRLPELLAADEDEPIFLVEGEKDVETLRSLGAVATCNPMGAGKWKPEYNKYFAGRHVVIIPDNDEQGKAHARRLIEELTIQTGSIRFIELTGLPEHGDVTDWLSLPGNTSEKLSELYKTAPLVAKDGKQLIQEESTGENSSSYFPLLSVEGLASLPRPEWLIKPEIVKMYLTCIYGPTQTAKSFLALNYALAAACEGHTVLYVIGENANGYYARARAWMRHYNKNPFSNLLFIPMPVQLLMAEQVAKLEKTIDDQILAQGTRPALVIFDTLSRCYVGGDENDAADMRQFVQACDALRRKYEATVMVVHHSPKAGGSPRGSSVITGDFDTIIETARKDERGKERTFIVKCEKQKDAKPFDTKYYHLLAPGRAGVESGVEIDEFDFSDDNAPVFVPFADTSLATNNAEELIADNGLEVLTALNLKAFEKGATFTNLMTELDVDYRNDQAGKKRYMREIYRLIERGYIEKLENGNRQLYKITLTGKDYVEPQPL